MPDIIRLLPDAVANQIAAGEVVQRPASVVKELVENAVDAGATEIKVLIKEAGKSLIQVIDNGSGMSETDARMAFERHATSKIKDATDLFNIQTLGFRGEALASIAAVAQVELRTKKQGDDIGIKLVISGSEIESSDMVSCPQGSNFAVRNLFFNIPARRKFLKSNNTEFGHILTEFLRIALTYPDVAFALIHNDREEYSLPQVKKFRQRIVNIFGGSYNKALVNISSDSPVVKINGYISKPEFARKAAAEQYMFINKRFMRNLLFHKAVMQACENLIPQGTQPSYFIYFEASPQSIDINIHPTKTEIKFEHGNTIFSILRVAIREAMGKANIIPSIDFDREGYVEMKSIENDTQIQQPVVSLNADYNPFEAYKYKQAATPLEKDNLNNWERLYEGLDNSEFPTDENVTETLFSGESQSENESNNEKSFLQFKGKYIMTSVKSGLMLVDQKRAHVRILYENYLAKLNASHTAIQQLLFPETIEISPKQLPAFMDLNKGLKKLGFDIDSFGGNTFVINGVPAELSNESPSHLLTQILHAYIALPDDASLEMDEMIHDKLAASFARTMSIPYGKMLSTDEMSDIIDKLFQCQVPNFTPSGKTIIHIFATTDIEQYFK